MAQIDLGSIKFNWKGSYSGATAYVVDDVVESSGSSYICIAATTGNAPPNATYWEQMSSAGTDGTDLTTTLTTQGDIVYRNASGLARLGAGTSGQALITQGTGANPAWGDVGGGLVQMKTIVYNTSESLSINNTDVNTGMTISITPTSSSNQILLTGMVCGGVTGGYGGFGWTVKRGGTDIGAPSSGGSSAQHRYHSVYGNQAQFGDAGQMQTVPIHILDNPSTTSAITYTLVARGVGGTSNMTLNRDNGTNFAVNSYFTVMEIDGGIIV